MRFVTIIATSTSGGTVDATWRENCMEHYKPMQSVQLEVGETIYGIPDSYRWIRGAQFEQWKRNAVVDTSELWYCEECKCVYAKGGGHWVKTLVNGKEEVSLDSIKPPKDNDPRGEAGPQPFIGATRCSQCHAWREVKGNLHVCPNCHTGDIVDDTRIPNFGQPVEMREAVMKEAGRV